MAHATDHDPFAQRCAHICVDMQRLFADETAWHTPWLRRVLPSVERLVAVEPQATVFTRFIPPVEAGEAHGEWRRYYQRWEQMTLSRLPPEMVELVPELRRFAPPAKVVDKRVYSPWYTPQLHQGLRRRGVEVVILSGGETDVCVLATLLGAIDLGYHVVLAEDCLCSSSDQAHDATVTLYVKRYGAQLTVMRADEILDRWRPEPL